MNAEFKFERSEEPSRNKLTNFLQEKLKSYPEILQRSFQTINENAKSDFRIMQWNMLARGLWRCEDGLNSEKSCTYDWDNFRFWRTLQELIRYDSDILCVEEADAYENIKPYMEYLGYTSIFCPKFDSPCLQFDNNVGPDGCAIFYHLSMFQIQTMSCEKIIANDEIHNQIFVILQLKHIKTGKLITVVCLHLKSKAINHERREIQIRTILESVSLHCSRLNIHEHPIFMCGDFNGSPDENFYNLIVNDPKIKNLKDAYSIVVDKKEPTTIKIRDSVFLRREIDYIFFNTKAIELCSYLKLPVNNELIESEGLPNPTYSSDHLSLVCDFKFI